MLYPGNRLACNCQYLGIKARFDPFFPFRKQKYMAERAPPPQLADFSHHMADNIRFADLDIQGHVNNVVFATFFETGRVGFSRDPVHGFSVPGAGIALRRIVIDYLAEMRFPGQVTIGTRVKRLGTTSLVLDHALFVEGTCTATGESTIVLLDSKTRRPKPFPEDVAAKLRAAEHRKA
jgi:acyl-CoA thioester hydrolase